MKKLAECRSQGPGEPPPRGALYLMLTLARSPGTPEKGAGEQLRQPEGVWPGSCVAFRAHLSSPWLTPSLTFSLSVSLSLSLSLPPTYYPENYVSKKEWKEVLCSVECKLCVYGVCVSFSGCLFSALVLCNATMQTITALAYRSVQRSKEHVFTSVICTIFFHMSRS